MNAVRRYFAGYLRASFWGRLFVLLVVLGVIGAAAIVAGLAPVKASEGHWPITRWFLSFTSGRAISTGSWGIDPPSLDDSDQVKLGAATYASNCQWCHGSPREPHPMVAAEMTPMPPYLPKAVSQWSDAELFYIARHGIKFTGMPAWPTGQRHEEIWPVVAYLRESPAIDAEQFARLTGESVELPGDAGVRPGLLRRCVACHGPRGRGRVEDYVPKLAGQKRAYLRASLDAYAARDRHSGIMGPIASRLNDQERERLAVYFSRQPPVEPRSGRENREQDDQTAAEQEQAGAEQEQAAAEQEQLELGEAIVRSGRFRDGGSGPTCAECHLPAREESPGGGGHRLYPYLGGQPAAYLETQLRLFRERKRGGTRMHDLMHPIADALTKEESAAAAAYLASLPVADADGPASSEGEAEDR